MGVLVSGGGTLPELNRICLNSINKNIIQGNEDIAELHFLTFENLHEYIEIPSYVVKKVKKGIYSYTLLSDLVRMSILAKFGGFYLDSTILITEKVPRAFLTYNFWSIKATRNVNLFYTGQLINKGNWKEYIYKGSNKDLVFSYVRDALLLYMKKYDYLIEYFLVDYCIDEAIKNIESVKVLFKDIEESNQQVEELRYYLNEPYDEGIWNFLTFNTTFFKLSYKFQWREKTESGVETFYGRIKKLYCN